MSLIDEFEKTKKKTYVFNGVRNVRARKRIKDKERFYWNGRLSPSKMYLTQCVWRFYQDYPLGLEDFEGVIHKESDLKDREGKIREDWDYWSYDGKGNHEYFQSALRELNLKKDKIELYKDINPNFKDFLPNDKKERYKNECIELPFWYEYKGLTLTGYVDYVVNIPKLSKNPIIGDLKFKHKRNNDWGNYISRDLPDIKHFTQVCTYGWIFNQNQEWLQKPVDIASLSYYNNFMCGDLAAEIEFYFKIPHDIIERYIDEQAKELYCWTERVDSCCTNPFCKRHGNEVINVKDYII